MPLTNPTTKKYLFRASVSLLALIIVCGGLFIVLNSVTHSRDEIKDGSYRDLFVNCDKTDETVVTNFTSRGNVSEKTTKFVYVCTATSPEDGKTFSVNVAPGKGDIVHVASTSCLPGHSVKGTVIIDREEYDSIILENPIQCVENPFFDTNELD